MSHPPTAPTPDAPRASRIRIERRAIRRWAVGMAIFAVAYGGALLLLRQLDIQRFAENAAEAAGLWGVVLFLALMAAAVMSPLPDSPIALAGLVAYGPVTGLVLVVAGSWAGAAVNFWLARWLGRERFRRRFPHWAEPMDDLAGRLGFELMVLLRFIPTVSFDVVSYAAGVTRMPFWYFAVATLLGQLPGPTAAALVGAHAGGSTGQKVGLSLLAMALIIGGLVLRRVLRRRTLCAETNESV